MGTIVWQVETQVSRRTRFADALAGAVFHLIHRLGGVAA